MKTLPSAMIDGIPYRAVLEHSKDVVAFYEDPRDAPSGPLLFVCVLIKKLPVNTFTVMTLDRSLEVTFRVSGVGAAEAVRLLEVLWSETEQARE